MDKYGMLDLEVDLTLEGVRRSRVGKREASTSVLEQIQGVN
ncbi:hypothetical protein SAMN04488689_101823 [Paenibacillus sp. cl6col]|nr:hypothetical protein SAMN04488689_101823 [Paenibacillus sp. cl6col]